MLFVCFNKMASNLKNTELFTSLFEQVVLVNTDIFRFVKIFCSRFPLLKMKLGVEKELVRDRQVPQIC